ncbi:phage holin family protein [Clostridium sp.]|uniref:phage holin family protein n=1 Tax=Clostridium sp. TaxID=1506 RepID=UPI0025BC1C85|nr:phage holin family protein [Clostridium sp.]
MDLSFISEYAVPVIVGICLCVGYVIKTSFSSIDNKYIPLIMVILGVALNIWINMNITPDILLAGMFSGLSSTGLHQTFKQLIGGDK